MDGSTTSARCLRHDGAADLATQVHRKLRSLIVLGQLAPGSRVVESAVAERLGVSRTPVRGALQQLQREGFVVSREAAKRAQLTIAPLSREDGRELFWVVGELEGLAAHLAATLPDPEREGLARQLGDINEALRSESLAARPDPHHIFDLHTRFHQSYVDAAAGARLLGLHEVIKPQAERYRRFYSTALGGAIGPSLDEHEAIIGHIAAGRAEEAARAARQNWRNAAERLVHTIDQQGELGGW